MCSLIWLTCRPSGVPIENQRGQGGGLRLFWNQVIKNTLRVGLEICLRPRETKLKQKWDIQGTFYRLKGDLKLRSNQPQNHNL